MTSYFLKTGYRASFLLEFVEKHVAAGPSGKFLVVHGATELIFSRPSKVEVVVKVSSITLRKTHLNVSKIIIFAESSLDSLSPLR